MKNIINSIPGYKVNEYSLVLNPHEELRNKIMHVNPRLEGVVRQPDDVHIEFLAVAHGPDHRHTRSRTVDGIEAGNSDFNLTLFHRHR